MQSLTFAWRRLTRPVERLRRLSAKLGRAGAVAIITAGAAPVLLMIVGFAADYGYASYLNQRFARATDSGTLGSVSQTAASTAGGYSQTAAMQAIGVNIFNANISDLPSAGVNFNLSVVSDGTGGVIATGSYTYSVPTFFGGILGFNNIPISGTAKTSARPVVYVNYYILVDTSQSMGIASTQVDMDALYNRVVSFNNHSNNDPGCVFGCHVKANIQGGSGVQQYTNEDLAHNYSPRINLRIDAAVSAIQSIIQTAASVAANTKNIKFALYEMQLDPKTNSLLTPISPLSNDYTTLLTNSSKIDLGDNVAGGTGDSDFKNEIKSFNDTLTSSGLTSNGNGASDTTPLNFIFIVTDGLADVYGKSCTSGHCTSAFDANNCTALKSKATVGTIYTTYSKIWAANDPKSNKLDGDFKNLVAPFTVNSGDQIATALQSCATTTDYAFQANDGPDIIAAMQSLFQRTQPSSARITQ